ncbi:hypothetical protein [Caballeronia concitans]|jgi:hypothetical protein|uniref:Uncharacterized protein n=1 Tax=Caballeronia concitans TaxID=1777133 RepID=A0A658QWF9_9BURK|nr:hypothetical protein [Caballeronia concitans]KIG03777.1 hypothetical protein BurMR1_4739 [Burkholderia sp. MR1]SAL28293.1 hypothetical protein AWB72_02286 [Caballeronia concitans]
MTQEPRTTSDDMDEPLSGATPSSDTRQQNLDAKEKQTHEASENALPSSQDKNPIPPDSTRR